MYASPVADTLISDPFIASFLNVVEWILRPNLENISLKLSYYPSYSLNNLASQHLNASATWLGKTEWTFGMPQI